MSKIPEELQEMFDLSQSVPIDDLSKLIKAAKEFQEFRNMSLTDRTFHDLKTRIEIIEDLLGYIQN